MFRKEKATQLAIEKREQEEQNSAPVEVEKKESSA